MTGGGGAESDRTGTGRTIGISVKRAEGTTRVEALFGTTNCDAGSGRLGETRQQVEIGGSAWMLSIALCGIPFMIMAIFGQCGSHGFPEAFAPFLQQ